MRNYYGHGALGRELFSYLEKRFGKIIYLFFSPALVYSLYKKHYMTMLSFHCLIVFIVIILSYLRAFIKKYFNMIICISLMISISISLLTYFQFKQTNYLYLTKSYIECVVLKNKDYSLINTSDYYIYQKETSYFHYIIDYKVDYMVNKQKTLKQYIKIIENILGKVDSYKIIDTNQYLLTFKNKSQMKVYIYYYTHFSIISFDGSNYHIKS